MQQKIIPYGTKHTVTVIRAEKLVLVLVDENKEGYIIVGHGLDSLPKVDDEGIIIFEQNDGVAKGHWQYYPNYPIKK